MIELSILIPHLPESTHHLRTIQTHLSNQLNESVEVLYDDRGREVPTGTKRNDLIQKAQGKYFVFIDCDDWVPYYYIEELLTAIKSDPDVITFIGFMTTNGGSRVDFVIKLGEQYEARTEWPAGITKYFRYPNHLCCFKKELVQHIRFPDIWIGEDYNWATQIRDYGVLKTEVHIEKEMYGYLFITNKT